MKPVSFLGDSLEAIRSVYVLYAFQKKSQTTSKLDLAIARFKDLMRSVRQ